MSIRYLLPKEGSFYKANLHAHSTVSDGTLTQEEAKDLYKSHGYSVYAFTDHRQYTYPEHLSDDEFLVLAGVEMDLNEKDKPWPFPKTYHINLVDTNPAEHKERKANLEQPLQEYYNKEALNTYIKEMSDLGFLVTYNHPYWSMQAYEDYIPLKNLFAMEIYNHGCELDGLYGGAPQVYDEMLRSGQKLFCLATDDNHNGHPVGDPMCDAFGGFTMIKAEELTYPSVINALKSGHFYASMGPEIKELYIEDNTLVVKCSPVEKIYAVTQIRNCHKELAEEGKTLTEARFPLNGNEGYIRIDCRDSKGLHAYSNAYFI